MTEDIKFDFDGNIKFLLDNKLKDTIENDIVLQDKIMNSDDFNLTFKHIEDSLNFLYEKNRVLEDIIKYSNLSLKNEINNAISDCKTLLAAIENDRDITKNNSFVKFAVPLSSGATAHTDRDNSVISETVLYDNRLTLSSTVINSFKPKTATKSAKHINNNQYNSIDDFLMSDTYRTFYMFGSLQGEAIEESITLKFDAAVKINKISFNVSNCLIDDILLTLDDDSELSIGNQIGLFKTANVKQIEIKLKCSNYMKSQVDYNDYKGSNNSFWDAVNDIKTNENDIVDKTTYYYYLFGLDNLKLDYVAVNNESEFYSKEIKIDKLNENEYITIEAEDSTIKGNIEYYIVDGTNVIPILPENEKEVIDEKIFYKTPTRFTYNSNKPVVIKKDGVIAKLSLAEATNINNDDSVYTVSYTPVVTNISSISNGSVKVRAIIRTYDKNYNSFINNISIKKYGGGKLWIDKY